MAASDQTTAFSATWEGSGLPTLAVGDYLQLDDEGESGLECDTSELVRPAATGAVYGPPISLAPGFCTLSMLFSDWDRSGRRDLRVSNDRHYYDRANGEEQLWRIAPGEAPRLYVDGWVKVQIEGMGIASYDLTGDGYPEVYLTSQGDNRLQFLTDGPSLPTYGDMSTKRGVGVPSPFTGGDIRPSTAWHPEFQDVNNDGFVDLFVAKGNVDEIPDYAAKDPSNLLLGRPDGTFQEARRCRRSARLRQGPWRGPGRLQPRRHARPRQGEPRRTGQALAERRDQATRRTRSRWATGWR